MSDWPPAPPGSPGSTSRHPAPAPGQSRERAARVEGLAARLEAVSYNAVLARGFALVQGPDGVTLTQASQVTPGANLTLTFQDGAVKATAAGGKPKPAKPPQGSLF